MKPFFRGIIYVSPPARDVWSSLSEQSMLFEELFVVIAQFLQISDINPEIHNEVLQILWKIEIVLVRAAAQKGSVRDHKRISFPSLACARVDNGSRGKFKCPAG